MKFDIITIFPEMFNSYFSESILGRAQKEKLIDIETHSLRKYTTDKHQIVDDTPYGGGAGMIMKVEPIFNCVQNIKDVKNKQKNVKTRVILFSAKGKRYTQRDAERLTEYDSLIFICGRYEGVDERVAEYIADEEISIGDYVLTGGEVPAMVLIDSVSRLIPGVLGNVKSLKEESHRNVRNIQDNKITKLIKEQQIQQAKRYLEYPQYTKPEEFNGWKVPKVLLSGNHKKIKDWRQKH